MSIISRVVLMGVGGTGSFLAEPLTRLLRFHPNVNEDAPILFVDGDKFEEKNQVRQLFPAEYTGKRKAKVIRDEVNRRFEKANVTSHNLYVKKNDLLRLLTEEDAEAFTLFISCVDNNASRVEAMEALDECKSNYVFMSPGNGLNTGQVITYAKVNGGIIIGDDPREFDPDYQNPNRAEIPVNQHIAACVNEQPSSPQLISTNMLAASLTLQNVQSLLDHQGFWTLIQFDSGSGRVLYGDAYVLVS